MFGVFLVFSDIETTLTGQILDNCNLQFFNTGIFWHLLFCTVEHTRSDTESNLLFSELMREAGQLVSSVRDFNEDALQTIYGSESVSGTEQRVITTCEPA